MTMEQIKISIAKDMKTTIEVSGVKGAACKDLTAAFEKALGSVSKTEETSDYYEQDIQTLDQF